MLHMGLAVDRYEVEALLGVGGLAEVWSARHRVLGTRRALKVLIATTMSESLVEEGRLQAALDHDNVLPVLDVLDLAGTPVLVMPLVEGPTLRALIADHPLPMAQAVPLFRDILEGVAAAHERGIVHCDLKPSNVLLHRRGERIVPKVADFGIAVRLGHRGRSSAGTREYAAPEQERGEEPSPAVDYFALGVLLHEVVTGKRPGAPNVDLGPLGELVRGLLQPRVADRLCDPAAVRHHLDTCGVAEHPLAASELGPIEQPGLPTAATAAPGPHSQSKPSLPSLRDTFVGRASECATLADWLGDPGLITITGPGGVGKTRLAITVAAALDAPVHFADLTDCRTAGDILRATAGALAVPLNTRSPEERLLRALTGRGRMVLVLDNFEQVVDHASDTVGRWMQAAPEVCILVTSRETLRLREERVFVLAPLGLPEQGATDAVTLFEARARQQDPGFVLDDHTTPVVEQLVTLLDGLPLAIELAAARCRGLSPDQLLERLGDRFRLLVSRERGSVVDRHRTLEATLDWSWDLLRPFERSALAQLSVFEGGWTLQAAEAVVKVDGHWVEDLLAELVDKSLVRTSRSEGGNTRMSLLVSVQAYASAKLVELGLGDEAQLRHMGWFAEDVDEERYMVHGGESLRRQDRHDLDNLHAVLRRALDRGDARHAANAGLMIWALSRGLAGKRMLVEPLVRLVALPDAPLLAHLLLGRVFASLGRLAEARDHLHQVADAHPSQPMLRMKALRHIAHTHWDTTRPSLALAPVEEALAMARALDSRAWEANIAALRATTRSMAGVDHDDDLHEALALTQAVGSALQEASLWNALGVRSSRGLEHDVTRRHYRRALALYEEHGDRRDRAWMLQNLAALAFEEGDLEHASTQLADAIRLFRLVGDRRTEGRRQKLLARILIARGDVLAAHEALDRGEIALHALNDDIGLGLLHVGRAEVCHAEGRLDRAREALERARGVLGHLTGTEAEEEVERVAAKLSQAADLDG